MHSQLFTGGGSEVAHAHTYGSLAEAAVNRLRQERQVHTPLQARLDTQVWTDLVTAPLKPADIL